MVLVKRETFHGIDAEPDTDYLVLCSVPQHSVGGDKMTRDYMRNSLSSSGFSVSGKKQTISFSCELKGPNNPVSPGLETYLHTLIRCCGLNSATVIDEATTYTTAAIDPATMWSCTIYYYLDGVRHALVGCRGNAVMEFSVNAVPKINFSMTGFYVAPGDVATPAMPAIIPDYEAPPCVNGGFEISAYNPSGVEKITFDLGMKVVEKKDINSPTGLSKILITGSEPKITLDCDVDSLANFNPYDLWSSGTLFDTDLTFGNTGNKVLVSAEDVRLDEPAKGDKNGQAIWNLSGIVTGNLTLMTM